MYGCYPSDDIMKERVPVEPVMSIKTRVSHIKTIEPGEKISYGCTYEAKETERIATLAIGYADGFVRGRKNPKVCINGKDYEVVGRICMDQCMIKIGMDDDIKVGDEAEAKEKVRIARLAIGYADGFVRGRKNPKVCINGKDYEVVGRICMDQCMIKIRMDDGIKVGEEALVFGNGGFSISEFSEDCRTI